MKREDIFEYVKEFYGTLPEYLWKKYPEYAVLRHNNNNKWYGVVMNLPEDKLGLDGDRMVDILDVKLDPAMIGSLLLEDGFYPAYHMNKTYWITILLDGTISDEDIKRFIEMSYNLTKK